MSSQKPTLPSIQIMLEGIGINNVNTTSNTGKIGHRRQLSDVNNNNNSTNLGLTSYLENLSLSTPKPIEPMTTWSPSPSPSSSPSSTPTSIHHHPIRPTPLYQYPYHHHRSARNLHSRSYSDYTHPYITSPPSSSSLLTASTSSTSSLSSNNNNNNDNNNTNNTNNNSDHSLPKTTTHSYLGTFHQQHRRAISTSTLDTIMQHTLYKSPSDHHHHHSPPPSLRSSHSTTTSLPLSPTLSIQTPSSITDEHHHYFDTDDDDHHHNEDECNYSTSTTATIKQQQNDHENKLKSITNDNDNNNNNNNNKSNNNNKYQCPYCQKGFSRPSSLRIHTYSHTGEKPFECPEEGCSRKFSVQSNMRRHLRVHRMGRHLKLKRSPPSIKPLAAKPSWMTENNDTTNTTIY